MNIKKKKYSIIDRLHINHNYYDDQKLIEDVNYVNIENLIFNEIYYLELDKAMNDENNRYEMKTLYHGTNHDNAVGILSTGIHKSKHGALGPGVYAGLFDKASTFAKCRKKNNEHYNLVIFELDILFKNLVTLDNLDYSEHRYDDVHYNGFRNPEWCCRDANRILLKKVWYL